ncbi:VanZ family protein [Bizionia paragorgiae]|uniref:VanZ family protein n=1 Tax=Bizionia paragorgiae TaxID=283786 RepID=UPI003A940A8D
MLKKSLFLLSIAYTLVLLLASLLNVNSITQGLPSNNDKFLHTAAHVMLTGLWFLTFSKTFTLNNLKSIGYASVLAIGLGVLIEVLQGTLTQNRTTDINDVFANVLGTVIVVLVILGLRFRELKNK